MSVGRCCCRHHSRQHDGSAIDHIAAGSYRGGGISRTWRRRDEAHRRADDRDRPVGRRRRRRLGGCGGLVGGVEVAGRVALQLFGPPHRLTAL